MTVYKKAGAGTPAINRQGDLMKSASESSTWDRNLQERMDQPGVPRGGRNVEMVKLACDIVWAGHPPHAFTGDGFLPPEMPFNQLNEYWPLVPLNARS